MEKLGYRAIAIEAPWTSSIAYTKKFVETCHGDIQVAQKALIFGAWYDASIQDLLEWLCQYNTSQPNNKVTFFGVDIQNPGAYDIAYLKNFFKVVDPGFLSSIQGLNQCSVFTDPEKPINSDCILALKYAKKRLITRRLFYEHATSKERVFLADVAVKSIWVWQFDNATSDFAEINRIRDEGMAELFIKLRNFYAWSKKTIIYAHDHHVGFNMDQRSPSTDYVAASMGTILKRHFSDRYFALGFLAYQTLVNRDIFPANEFADLPLASGATSIELRLHKLNFQSGLLLFNRGFTSHSMNYLFNDTGYQWSQNDRPSNYYDGVFYSDVCPPMIPFWSSSRVHYYGIKNFT